MVSTDWNLSTLYPNHLSTKCIYLILINFGHKNKTFYVDNNFLVLIKSFYKLYVFERTLLLMHYNIIYNEYKRGHLKLFLKYYFWMTHTFRFGATHDYKGVPVWYYLELFVLCFQQKGDYIWNLDWHPNTGRRKNAKNAFIVFYHYC